MRLEWLEDLLAVAETGSFQEAADRRRLTQSAFSRRIQHIEEQIGVELFDRTRKPVQLRPATAELRDQMAKLANDLRQLVNDLRRGERMASNRIVVASQHALTTALTPSLLDRVQSSHADIFLKLRSANLDDCFALLLSRQADLGLVYRLPDGEHPISSEFIETVVVGHDRLVPVLATARAERLDEELRHGKLPYIAYPAEVFLGQVVERLVLPTVRRLADPVPKAETALTLAALEMAAVGVAVAWVPLSLAGGRISTGGLTDFSAILPSVPLDVTAVRLRGTAGRVDAAIWAQLVSLSEAKDGQVVDQEQGSLG